MLQALILVALAIEVMLYVALGRVWTEAGVTASVISLRLLTIGILWRMSHAGLSYVATGALRWRDRKPAPLGSSLKAFASEFSARFVSYHWSQPFHQWAMPEEPLPSPSSGRVEPQAVLLVHGFFSSRGMFVRLRSGLAARGLGSIYTVNLHALFSSIDAMVPVLKAKIESICAEAGVSQIDLVAHSMGGLVARAYIAQHGAARVRKLVTIGSPHHGTALAAFGLGRNARQMRRGSAWLETLVQMESAVDDFPPTLSIYSLNDDLVYPPESSRLHGAENVPVAAVGHVAMLFSTEVELRVANFLKV